MNALKEFSSAKIQEQDNPTKSYFNDSKIKSVRKNSEQLRSEFSLQNKISKIKEKNTFRRIASPKKNGLFSPSNVTAKSNRSKSNSKIP